MSLIDHLFQFELFSVPVWKMAEKAILQKDTQTFKKRWPIWSKRLKYFPRLRSELFSEIFTEKNIQGLEPFQRDLLQTLFEYSTIDPSDPLVASTLSRLCLSHNWEALDAIQQYIPFNAETHTIIACAMTHEATSASWDRYLSRPRLSMQTVEKYIQDNQILPYEHLENIWKNTVFYSPFDGFKKINTYGFTVPDPIGNHLSVLPNFDQKSLWDYTIIYTPNPKTVQKFVDRYPLSEDYLEPIFVRKHPLSKDFVYDLIQRDFPLCTTLNNLLTEPLKLGVNYTNIVEILKEASPSIAPAFEEALEQIANEKQRQKLLEETSSAQSVSRRKM